MNTLYRIYTEDVNRNEILEIVSKYFDAFTFIMARGAWKGKHESSLIIEIISNPLQSPLIRDVARAIKIANRQQAVLVTKSAIESELV
jgi:hypothetical protein